MHEEMGFVVKDSCLYGGSSNMSWIWQRGRKTKTVKERG